MSITLKAQCTRTLAMCVGAGLVCTSADAPTPCRHQIQADTNTMFQCGTLVNTASACCLDTCDESPDVVATVVAIFGPEDRRPAGQGGQGALK